MEDHRFREIMNDIVTQGISDIPYQETLEVLEKHSYLSDEQMRAELIAAHKSGKYFLYGRQDQLQDLSHDQLQIEYINMKNYLSDSRTHSEN